MRPRPSPKKVEGSSLRGLLNIGMENGVLIGHVLDFTSPDWQRLRECCCLFYNVYISFLEREPALGVKFTMVKSRWHGGVGGLAAVALTLPNYIELVTHSSSESLIMVYEEDVITCTSIQDPYCSHFPAPSANVAPSSEFPLEPVVAPPEIHRQRSILI
ncbi:hypothetical protein Tco_0747431 [Tanacetum coccineum]|uniref:Uncharacterized protein n=1 Tax=Tanacetum coccineum TaxID=301880 RepID=A0ABQ4YV87_9ASTR